MVRAITLSAIVVLLVSSGAMAQIDLQYQGWSFGATNHVDLHGGPGEGGTVQGVGDLSIQNIGINPDMDGNPTVTASQGFGTILFQAGGATTEGGPVSIDQNLSVIGVGLTVNNNVLPAGQAQSIGDLSDPTMQYEGVLVESDQTLDKTRGSNSEAEGLNLVGFGMGQSAGNNCAQGCQTSIILGGQYSTLEGAAQADGTVEAGLTAQVQQFQTANNVVVTE